MAYPAFANEVVNYLYSISTTLIQEYMNKDTFQACAPPNDVAIKSLHLRFEIKSAKHAETLSGLGPFYLASSLDRLPGIHPVVYFMNALLVTLIARACRGAKTVATAGNELES